MGISLAWWHNYKWASHAICSTFGRDFIGPFFHQLFPDRAFDISKMQLPAISTLLTYLRLAFPALKKQLLKAKEGEELSVSSKTMLDNLWVMFDYFIPVVSTLPCIFLVSCPAVSVIHVRDGWYITFPFSEIRQSHYSQIFSVINDRSSPPEYDSSYIIDFNSNRCRIIMSCSSSTMAQSVWGPCTVCSKQAVCSTM